MSSLEHRGLVLILEEVHGRGLLRESTMRNRSNARQRRCFERLVVTRHVSPPILLNKCSHLAFESRFEAGDVVAGDDDIFSSSRYRSGEEFL